MLCLILFYFFFFYQHFLSIQFSSIQHPLRYLPTQSPRRWGTVLGTRYAHCRFTHPWRLIQILSINTPPSITYVTKTERRRVHQARRWRCDSIPTCYSNQPAQWGPWQGDGLMIRALIRQSDERGRGGGKNSITQPNCTNQLPSFFFLFFFLVVCMHTGNMPNSLGEIVMNESPDSPMPAYSTVKNDPVTKQGVSSVHIGQAPLSPEPR